MRADHGSMGHESMGQMGHIFLWLVGHGSKALTH